MPTASYWRGLKSCPGNSAPSMTGSRSEPKKMRNILHNFAIHFVDINITPKRLAVLKDAVESNGGTFIASQANIDSNTILLADFESIEQLEAAFIGSRSRRIKRYTREQFDRMMRLDWLLLSLEHGSTLSQSMFRLSIVGGEHPGHEPKLRKVYELASGSGTLAKGYVNDGVACKHRCPLAHPNSDITDQLQKVMHHRYVTGDSRSELSYSNAIAIISGYPQRISSCREALSIKGIGPKIASLIDEYLQTGRIELVEKLMADVRYKSLSDLCSIYGVGPRTAEKWYQMGLRTVEDVRKRAERLRLTETIRQGLKYYDDMLQPMSRAEVDAVHDFVKRSLPEDAKFYPTGGYRRGKPFSNDVDVLVLSRDPNTLEKVMRGLGKSVRAVLGLSKASYPLKWAPKSADKKASSNRLGTLLLMLAIPGQERIRRVDIVHVPIPELLPWAQLGWTGSRQFERSIRQHAERNLGITLASDGAFCNRSKVYLAAATEEECFRLLKLEYVDPVDRNC